MVDTENERKIIAESLRQCNLDYGLYACTLIEDIRRADESNIISLNDQIDHWNWLLVGGEETALPALEECNRLLRKVLLKSPVDEPVVRKIIRIALQFQLPQVLSNAVSNGGKILSFVQDGLDYEQDITSELTAEKIEHAALEFYGLCSLIDINNFVITIALKLNLMFKYTPISESELSMIGGVKRVDKSATSDWEASLRVRARAEQTLRDEMLKKKATDQNTRMGMVQQHVDVKYISKLRNLMFCFRLSFQCFVDSLTTSASAKSIS